MPRMTRPVTTTATTAAASHVVAVGANDDAYTRFASATAERRDQRTKPRSSFSRSSVCSSPAAVASSRMAAVRSLSYRPPYRHSGSTDSNAATRKLDSRNLMSSCHHNGT